jgi:hypothetical protein
MNAMVEQPEVTGTLRVTSGLTLPRRIAMAGHPGEAGGSRRLEQQSLRTTTKWATYPWKITDARATHLRFQSATSGGFHPVLPAAKEMP